MSELDALNDLAAEATTVKGKSEGPERPVLPVPPAAKRAFVRLVAAKAVAEVVNSRIEVEEALVNSEMMDSYAQTLFNSESGSRPLNPRLTEDKGGRPDLEGLFQVQERYVLNVDEGDGDYKGRLIAALTTAGLSAENAAKLATKEVDTNPITMLRPFTELLLGHYEGKQFVPATTAEKAVAAKLMDFVKTQLSPEERKLSLVKKENAKVQKGFLERVKGYCANVAQVKAVFKVLKPVHFMSKMKFGVSDTPETRNARLAMEAANILGVK